MSAAKLPIETISEKLTEAWIDVTNFESDLDYSPFLGRVRFEAGVLYDNELILRNEFGMEAIEPTWRDILRIADSAARTMRLRLGSNLIEVRAFDTTARKIILVFSPF